MTILLDISVPGSSGTAGDSPFDQIRRVRPDGTEYWSAREMMPLLGYDRWENFVQAIERAKAAIEAQNNNVTSHVRDATKVVRRPQGGSVKMADYELTRFAAYQVAMCGDPRKPEVAAALAYFAVRTREAETGVTALSRERQIAIGLKAAVEVIAEQEAKIGVLEPKAEQFDTWMASGDTVYVAEWAKSVGLTGPEAFSAMRDHGILSKQRRTDHHGGFFNTPLKRYVHLFKMKQEYVKGQGFVSVPRITPAGCVELARIFAEAGIIDHSLAGGTRMPALPGGHSG